MDAEAIARCAYSIWELAGRPNGKAVEHWLQAERELAFKLQDPPQRKSAGANPIAAATRKPTKALTRRLKR